MTSLPRISIITSSYNQGEFIGRTIDSVLAQEYPNLEHIIVDGMSKDETPEVLARYRHLQIIREPDTGQADAINKGFRAATGDILCFLNSDDTLLPGALHRVAREIDPARGRHVVMGRCRFIDEHDRFIGIEHPSSFESHRRVLEIWKGYCIPQPAVFWTPEVWRRCGPLNEREQLLLDYDLFCRFSAAYDFHFVDQPLATYRLHMQSKTSSVSDEERLEQSIQVSRRYWGGPNNLMFWQTLWSYGMFRFDRKRRAMRLIWQGREEYRRAERLRAILYLAVGAALAPDVLANVLLMPVLKPRVWRALQRRGELIARVRAVFSPRQASPHTLAWCDHVGQHGDGWVGPTFITTIEVTPGQSKLRIDGALPARHLRRPLAVEAFIDGRSIGRKWVKPAAAFTIELPLGVAKPGSHELKLVASSYAVPHELIGNNDHRPLAFLLVGLTPTGES